MEGKTKSYIIFVGWAIYVSLLMFYWNQIIAMTQTSHFLIGFLLYYLTNPAYLLIVYGVIRYTTVTTFKKIIASILLIFALDIVTSPRILLNELNSCISMTLDTGTIFIKWLFSKGIPLNLSNLIFYWLLPILFFWLSMELLGYTQFLRKIKNGV